jgi:hypothetical protein
VIIAHPNTQRVCQWFCFFDRGNGFALVLRFIRPERKVIEELRLHGPAKEIGLAQ